MGMTILKIYFHLRAAIKKFFYKLFFGKSIHFGNKTTFRKNFNLYIEKGAKVTFGEGVTIGNNCVIGAGCLVYKDIPDNSIVKNNSNLIAETIKRR